MRLTSKKEDVLAKTGGKCAYCGCDLSLRSMTIDHIQPQSQGGTHELENLLPACKTCNTYKGGRTVEEYKKYLAHSIGGVIRSNKLLHNCERWGYLQGKTSPKEISFYYERIGLTCVMRDVAEAEKRKEQDKMTNDGGRWTIGLARRLNRVLANKELNGDSELVKILAEGLVNLADEVRDRAWHLTSEARPSPGFQGNAAILALKTDGTAQLVVYDAGRDVFFPFTQDAREPIEPEKVLYWRMLVLPAYEDFNNG